MYSRSKKLSGTEKKLQILKSQLYGKQTVVLPKTLTTVSAEKEFAPSHSQQTLAPQADINYLKHDLLKISFLATLAIGIQLLLFLAIQQQIIKF